MYGTRVTATDGTKKKNPTQGVAPGRDAKQPYRSLNARRAPLSASAVPAIRAPGFR
jgi:hypothetical protein